MADNERHTYWATRPGSPKQYWKMVGLVFGGYLLLIAGGAMAPSVLGMVAAIAGVAMLFGGVAYQTRGRLAIHRGAHGLTEWFWYRLPRHTPWSALLDVDLAAEHCDVETRRGRWRFGPELLDWRRLVANLRRAVGQPEPEPVVLHDDPVPPEQVAEWLQLKPGELAVRSKSPLIRFAIVYLGLVIGMMGYLAVLTGEWQPFVIIGGLFGVLTTQMAKFMRRYRVAADAEGLDVMIDGRPRRIGWHEIIDVIWTQPGQTTLCTPYGDALLETTTRASRRIVAAAKRAVEARKQGFQLPQPDLVPPAALSRMTGHEAAAERGISVVAEGPAE